MPYPTITQGATTAWWQKWKESENPDTPPERPRPEMSNEGDTHDWETIARDVIERLSTLHRRSTDKGVASKDRIRSNRYEAFACAELHAALPRDAALTDPWFWTWLATGPGFCLILRRYPPTSKNAIPDVANFTSKNGQENFYYRLWFRGEAGHDPRDEEDPYRLARYGGSEFWRSHIQRQNFTQCRPMLDALLHFQYPDGPEGKPRLNTDDIRLLIKRTGCAATNIMTETLDHGQATNLLLDQLAKMRGTP